MSYSRWGSRGSGHWYTFWHCPRKDIVENRDTAIFCVCGVKDFTAKDLRDDMDGCMSAVQNVDNGDVKELRQYAQEFLKDVDDKYPSPPAVNASETNKE